jgi:hypothetical protein
MKQRSRKTGQSSCLLAILTVGLVIAGSSSAAAQIVVPGMVGHWEGNARIIVTWCQQTNLPVVVDIRADGTVTGKIGDATFTHGQLRRNRGWLGRKLNIKTDYIITGRLIGPIVRSEGITRSGIKMPLTFSGGNFTGAIHTTGSKVGAKQRGILTARLTLARTNPDP